MLNSPSEITLLNDLLKLLSKKEDLCDAVELVLEKTLQATNWDYAEAWIWNPSLHLFVFESFKHDGKAELTEFVEKSREFKFSQDESLLGKALQSGESFWENDLTKLPADVFSRHKLAESAGLKSALTIPVIVSENVKLVLVYFLSSGKIKDQRIIDVVTMAAKQLELVIAWQTSQDWEQKAQIILKNLNMGVYILDQDNRISYWNPYMTELSGYSVDEVLGKTENFLYPQSGSEEFLKLSESFYSSDKIQTELLLKCRNGQIISYYAQIYAWRKSGKISGRIIYIMDKDELQKTKISFDHSLDIQNMISKLTSLVLQGQPFEITLQNFLKTVLELPWLSFMRQGCLFLVDDKSGDLVMQANYGLNQKVSESCIRVKKGHCLCGKAFERGEIIFKADVDEEHDIQYPEMQPHGHYCSPLKTASGKIIGLLNFYVSPGHVSKSWEIQFINILSNLLVEIIEREAVLKQKHYSEWQLMHLQKEESIGRLASAVAHDFNNLLSIIQGNAEMTFDSLPENMPDRSNLAEIVLACKRASSLTRQLLLFTRKEAFESIKIDLNEIVRDLAKMLGRLIGEQKTLDVKTTNDPIYITGDPGQIEQLILNLTVNARDAISIGGRIAIQVGIIKDFEDLFSPNLAHKGDAAFISVKDTGTGIAPEILPQIFEAFFTTKQAGHGTGLGLATAKKIVDEHHGKIDIKTQQGVGSQFTVYLPLACESEEQHQRSKDFFGEKGQGQRILIIEDDENLLSLQIKILSKHGYSVSGGTDPITVLNNRVEDNEGMSPFDLVFTDLTLPGFGEIELIKFIQQNFLRSKILATTGYLVQDSELIEYMHATKIPLLHKPYSTAALLAAISELLVK